MYRLAAGCAAEFPGNLDMAHNRVVRYSQNAFVEIFGAIDRGDLWAKYFFDQN